MKQIHPQLFHAGSLLPCARIRQLQKNPEELARGRLSRADKQAYVLAALLVRMAHVSAYPEKAVKPASERSYRDDYLPERIRVVPTDLQLFPEIKSPALEYDHALIELLGSMPISLVEQVVDWAPPVVSPRTRHGRYRVLANQLPALMFRFHFPYKPITCRVTVGDYLHPTYAQCLYGIGHGLSDVVRVNKKRIITFTESTQEARFLFDDSAAYIRRIRKDGV